MPIDPHEQQAIWLDLDADTGYRRLCAEFVKEIEAAHQSMEEIDPHNAVAIARLQERIKKNREFIGAAKARLNSVKGT